MATQEDLKLLFKRKRKNIRANITRFSTEITEFKDEDSFEKLEYTYERLVAVLNDLKTVDNEIHNLFTDEEYENDITQCESYIDTAELAIFKARKIIKNNLSISSPTATHINDSLDSSNNILATNAHPLSTHTHTVKLPTIKLDTFRGDIEQWQCFWEQFKSSIDNNVNLSVIDKHVFLRGYLEDEPRRLVDGISISASTYETTKSLLQNRYGDKNRIIQAHLDFLESISPVRNPTPTALNDVFIECNRRLQALTALGEDINAYGRILAPKILRAFPEDICRRWIIYAKKEKISEGDIKKLVQYLSDEVEGALTALKIQGEPSFDYSFKPSTAAFHVKSKTQNQFKKPSPFCPFCEAKGHWPQQCNIVTDIDTRIEKLKSTNRCFLCTGRGHSKNACARREKACCIKCKKKHHVSICKNNVDHSVTTSTNKIDIIPPNISPNTVHLQTAKVFITGPTGIVKLTRCLLDGGSQSSFIHSDLVDSLKLTVVSTQSLEIHGFESTGNATCLRRKVSFQLSSICNKSSINMEAFESNNKYVSHPSVPIDISQFAYQKRMKLADPYDNMQNLPIQVLIGADFYWQVINSRAPFMLSNSLALVSSKLGWILSGPRSCTTVSNVTTINYLNTFTQHTPIEESLRCFWDLETIGITTNQVREMSEHNKKILQNFYDSYQIVDDRRIVSLPWKPNISLLSDNKLVAEKRFYTLQKRLSSNEDLKTQYETCMLDYIKQEHVEMCPLEEGTDNIVYYLPHHAVKKKRKNEIKWRIVFDASSHDPGKPSLNDALEVGPNLLPESVGCLLRFRLHEYAIACDGKQAFLQLILHPKDRDATRFFWYKLDDSTTPSEFTNEVATYRFTRLPFGLTCSPFLLCAATRELANKHLIDFPAAAPLLDKDLYMDDFVASVETESDIVVLQKEIKNMMSLIKLPMEKWVTNSLKLQSLMQTNEENFKVKVETTVLGIEWNTETDTLGNAFKTSLYDSHDKPLTKRWLLRCIASLYDPLGLFTPLTITAKIIFQDTWILGIKWNEILPTNLANQWQTFTEELDAISSKRIPRFIGISSHVSYNIHVFCDASERAYGAALYIVSTHNNQSSVHLVISRSRLSPIKKVTLPRLELLAALIGSRLLKYFCTETGISPTNATLWSDSKVTLGWIRSDPNKWKTFVCNRITEIASYTDPSQWNHCSGKENPADKLSRGVSPYTLKDLNIWWNGPTWLTEPRENWPDSTKEDFRHNLELKKKKEIQTFHVTTSHPIIEAKNYSSYFRLLRVTARILRFITNCRSREKKWGELDAEDLNHAKNYWIQTVQKQSFPLEYEALLTSKPLPKNSKILKFNPFFKNSMIHIGGRLQFSELPQAEKHPILLEGAHHFTSLLIHHTHIRMHHLGVRIVLSELRSEFWILRGRQAIKKVIRKCLPCKIMQANSCTQIEAPLPADRIIPAPPFTTTGIDFAGPVYVRRSKSYGKVYIALFTCSVTRALHIELLSDLSTDNFLLTLQRFVGRRGLPCTVYTDNATTFQAANKELAHLWSSITSSKIQQFYAHNGIKWKFIVPRAAWWGGWWERLIGSVKRCLRKTLGRALLTEEQLSTVLIGIEAALNSRPLTNDDSNDSFDSALTPSHFLIGRKLTLIPSNPEGEKPELTRVFRQQQDLLKLFWNKWSKEYLLQLRSFHEVKNARKTAKIAIGDLVLLNEEVRPRHMWKRGRILEIIEGRDGKPRACTIKVGSGTQITRPLQLVIPLEIDQGGEDVEKSVLMTS